MGRQENDGDLADGQHGPRGIGAIHAAAQLNVHQHQVKALRGGADIIQGRGGVMNRGDPITGPVQQTGLVGGDDRIILDQEDGAAGGGDGGGQVGNVHGLQGNFTPSRPILPAYFC